MGRIKLDTDLQAATVCRGAVRRCVGYENGRPVYGEIENLGVLNISINPHSGRQWWGLLKNIWRYGWQRSQ